MVPDYEAIKKAAEKYGPEISRFLRDMISHPSESAEEGEGWHQRKDGHQNTRIKKRPQRAHDISGLLIF